MQGMPGALQVLAALLHGVQTTFFPMTAMKSLLSSARRTFESLRPRWIWLGIAQATTFFQHALLPRWIWLGPLLVFYLAEHHHGKVRRLRLVLAKEEAITHLTKAEITSLLHVHHSEHRAPGTQMMLQDVDLQQPHITIIGVPNQKKTGVQGQCTPRSHGNLLLHHPGNHSAAFLNMSNRRPH